MTQELIDALEESFENSPKRTLHRRSQYLDISKNTLHRILKEDLDQIQVVHSLNKVDMDEWLEMALWVTERFEDVRGNAQTVNSEECLEVLERFWDALLPLKTITD